MNPIVKESLLFDCYGQLLTEKKRSVMALYHEEDLSLSEIADEFGISRAAVHDSLKHAERQLADYEETLHMVERLQHAEQGLAAMESVLEEIKSSYPTDANLHQKLDEIHRIALEIVQK